MAIPKPEPRDWQVANAKELQVTDREVLAMLRDAKKRVDAILAELPAGKQEIRRAQLEQTRARLLAEQASVFERLGDIVSARRARAASRSAGLSAAADAALLSAVGKDAQGQYLYESALKVADRQIEAAMARMKLSQLPLSQRIYNSSVWMGGRLGRLINETLATGLNAQEFARRAKDWFNPNTPGGVRYAAMRLARTEINNAFHAMTAARAAEEPWVEEVEWNLSKSHPQPDICNAVHAGSPYPSDRVPARPHPQCMCYITPKPVSEDEFIDRFVAGDYDDYLDQELTKSGWYEEHPEEKTLTKRLPGPAKDVKRMPTQKVPGIPEGDGDPQFTTLKEAGLLDVGSEFLYHGYSKSSYAIKPRHVRVALGKAGNAKSNARQLFDVQTGEYVEQQANANAKWWIEKISDPNREPAKDEKRTPSGKTPKPAEKLSDFMTRIDSPVKTSQKVQNWLLEGKSRDEIHKLARTSRELSDIIVDRMLRENNVPVYVMPRVGDKDEQKRQPESRPVEIKAEPKPEEKPKPEPKPEQRQEPQQPRIAPSDVVKKPLPKPKPEPVRPRPSSSAPKSAAYKKAEKRIKAAGGMNSKVSDAAKKVFLIQEQFIGDRILRVKAIRHGMPDRLGGKKYADDEVKTRGAITYRGEIFTNTHLHEMGDAFKRSAEVGHSARCDHDHEGLDYVMAHEMGHAFLVTQDQMETWMEVRLNKVLGEVYGTNPGVAPSGWASDRVELWNKWLQTPEIKSRVGKEVSRYATTNMNEFFAEVWTIYTMNSNASPEIRKIGDVMAEVIKAMENR